MDNRRVHTSLHSSMANRPSSVASLNRRMDNSRKDMVLLRHSHTDNNSTSRLHHTEDMFVTYISLKSATGLITNSVFCRDHHSRAAPALPAVFLLKASKAASEGQADTLLKASKVVTLKARRVSKVAPEAQADILLRVNMVDMDKVLHRAAINNSKVDNQPDQHK